jgi:hypothetical protein
LLWYLAGAAQSPRDAAAHGGPSRLRAAGRRPSHPPRQRRPLQAEGVKLAAAAAPAATPAASGDADADAAAEEGEESDSVAEASSEAKPLLPWLKRLPVKRAVTYSNATSDTFSFTLAYNTSSPNGLPPGVSDPLIGAFEVSGVADVIQK